MCAERELLVDALLWAAREPAADASPTVRAKWLRDQVDLLDRLGDSGAFCRVLTAELRQRAAAVLVQACRVEYEAA